MRLLRQRPSGEETPGGLLKNLVTFGERRAGAPCSLARLRFESESDIGGFAGQDAVDDIGQPCQVAAIRGEACTDGSRKATQTHATLIAVTVISTPVQIFCVV